MLYDYHAEKINCRRAVVFDRLSDHTVQLTVMYTLYVQVAQLVLQLIWTSDVTEALRKSEADRKVMSKTKQSVADLLNVILGLTITNASAVDRINFESLAILQTYYRDSYNDLVSGRQ